MSNMSDKDIDKRFIEAAEGANFSFDEAGWEDMQQRLDTSSGPSAGQIVGTALVIIAILGLGIWGVRQGSEGLHNNYEIANSINAHSTIASISAMEVESLTDRQTGKPSDSGGSAVQSIQKVAPVIVKQVKGVGSMKNIETETGERNNLYSGKVDQPSQVVISDEQEFSASKSVAIEPKEPSLLDSKGVDDWKLPQGNILIEGNETINNEDEKEAKSGSRWAIKFQLAPDVSSVGYFNGGKVGNTYGVSIDYQVADKLRISAGALISRKYYNTTEQVASYGYYGGTTTDSERLDGNCQILDIPISLSYLALMRSNYSLFLSGGISSYLILSEEYQLKKNDQVEWDRSYANKNNHFASILNLSVGYERAISRSLSFQFEPFIKIPVQDIGEGKVDLVSSGAFLNLRYKFLNKE